jgi:hypothetical protein
MAPRCLSPSQLGQIYKHHGGFRVQLNTSNRIVRGPGRPGYLRARQDLARARTCPSREAMVAFVSGGCSANDENLPSDPETLRAEQTACFSSRRLCGKQTPSLSQRRIGGGKRPPCFVRQRVSVALLRPRAEAKAAPALRGDNPQEPPSRTMTGNAGAAGAEEVDTMTGSAGAAPALRGDNPQEPPSRTMTGNAGAADPPQEPPSRTMTGNAGAAPMVARGVAAARAETPRAEAARAEAARAEAAGAEARWEASSWSRRRYAGRQGAADMLVEATQAASAQSDARAEAARAEAARAEAAQAKASQSSEARWQEAKMLALAALATTPPQRQQNLIKRKHDPRKR